MWPNLVTFTEEILNRKFRVFCRCHTWIVDLELTLHHKNSTFFVSVFSDWIKGIVGSCRKYPYSCIFKNRSLPSIPGYWFLRSFTQLALTPLALCFFVLNFVLLSQAKSFFKGTFLQRYSVPSYMICLFMGKEYSLYSFHCL